MWDYREILKATNGELIRLQKESFVRISSDSRTIQEGEFFIPLKGKRYDGHQFIREAIEKSKGGTLCEREKLSLVLDLDATVIAVNDTNEALKDIAFYKRKKMDSIFIGITGSCGKTTTKEALVQMIKKDRKVSCNEKNYNNIFGVCLSIISIEDEPEVCVFELGTNSFGEIRTLTKIVDPTISAITNILPAHLEGLKTIEGVLEEKLDLFRFTRDAGIIFVNLDDERIRSFRSESKKILYFGIKNRAPFSLEVKNVCGWEGYEVLLNLDGKKIETRVKILGFHNLYNILLASSIASTIGIPEEKIKEALEEFRPCEMRMSVKKSKKGYVVIDDSYNANPASMYQAISTFSELPCEGKKILVLGDMNELGDYSSYYHTELGRYIDRFHFHYVLFLGEKIRESYSQIKRNVAFYFEEREGLLQKLFSILKEGDSVLVKGSRSLNMDTIVKEIV